MATENNNRNRKISPFLTLGVIALAVAAFFVYETIDDQDDIAIATQYEPAAQTPVTSSEILNENNPPVEEYVLVDPTQQVSEIEPAAGIDEIDSDPVTYNRRAQDDIPTYTADMNANEALSYNK